MTTSPLTALGWTRVVAIAVVALLVGAMWPGASAEAARAASQATTAPATSTTIRVEAFVDGRSQLILEGATARWHHFEFAAPGRHEFANEPTIVNGVRWFPSWPDVPDRENRFCYCYSNVFSGVAPPLPAVGFEAHLRVIQGRGSTRVVQPPSASNGYSLVIEFDDTAPSGPAWYIVEFDLPTPRDAASELQEHIDALRAAGSLTAGQSHALDVKVAGTVTKLESGNTTSACNRLRAFDNQVRALTRSHVLTPSETEPLRNGSKVLATLAGCS